MIVEVLAGDHGPGTACDESFPLAAMLMPEVRFPDAGCGGRQEVFLCVEKPTFASFW